MRSQLIQELLTKLDHNQVLDPNGLPRLLKGLLASAIANTRCGKLTGLPNGELPCGITDSATICSECYRLLDSSHYRTILSTCTESSL